MIKLSNITKSYTSLDPPSYALRDINLTIRQGEIVGIVGQSGAGKSTRVSIPRVLAAANKLFHGVAIPAWK
jgi:ABC-type methionine transport system ATPase subunit